MIYGSSAFYVPRLVSLLSCDKKENGDVDDGRIERMPLVMQMPTKLHAANSILHSYSISV